ncbi:hypothetical protein SUGI_0263160 [Cryptomeria japonica]|nr:hypothetical protein SUGI_0263160 [Cryptomeria japonica]
MLLLPLMACCLNKPAATGTAFSGLQRCVTGIFPGEILLCFAATALGALQCYNLDGNCRNSPVLDIQDYSLFFEMVGQIFGKFSVIGSASVRYE